MCTGTRPIAIQKALTALKVTSWTCKDCTVRVQAKWGELTFYTYGALLAVARSVEDGS